MTDEELARRYAETGGRAQSETERAADEAALSEGTLPVRHLSLGSGAYSYGPLPITPGSELDVALNVIANNQINCRNTDEGIEAFKLIFPSNPAHLLALGARIYFLRTGVSDPLQLVAEQYGQWFGRPMRRYH